MGIKESALSAITSITQSDYVRAVTSAGASRKITLSNLAKTIVESYTGSTLGGSSQSIKSAIDSFAPGSAQTFSSLDAIPLNQFGYCTLSNSEDYPASGVNAFCYFRFGSAVGRSALIAIRTASPSGVEVYVNARHNDNWRGWKTVQLS